MNGIRSVTHWALYKDWSVIHITARWTNYSNEYDNVIYSIYSSDLHTCTMMVKLILMTMVITVSTKLQMSSYSYFDVHSIHSHLQSQWNVLNIYVRAFTSPDGNQLLNTFCLKYDNYFTVIAWLTGSRGMSTAGRETPTPATFLSVF